MAKTIRELFRNLLWMGSISYASWSCALLEEGSDQRPIVFNHEASGSATVKARVDVQFPEPLPNGTIQYLTLSNGDSHAVRLWDIDHDGLFDYAELLGADGKPTLRAFEFTGDGNPDFVQYLNPQSRLKFFLATYP